MPGSAPGTSAVTVVIPVWGARYAEMLEDAVASVRRQEPRPRIVLVDNASDEPLPSVDGVDVVRTAERVTRGAARNLGLQQVRTELVLFLDADDELLDGSLAFLEAEIAAVPGAVACAGSRLDPDTGARHRVPRRAAYPLSRLPGCFAVANAVWSLYPSQGGAVMRTARVRDARGYADADSSEDWAMRASLAFRGRVVLVNRPTAVYTQYADRRARSTASLLREGRLVRRRLRSDPGLPRWARAALPAIAAAQVALLCVPRPIVTVARSLRRSMRNSDREVADRTVRT